MGAAQEMIPSSSNRLSSRCKEGRETFKSIAHFETDPGMRTSFFPVCLACIKSQKAAFCAIPL